MTKNVVLDADGRVMVLSNPPYTSGNAGEIAFDFRDDFDFDTLHDWRVVKGRLVFDPPPAPEPPESVEEKLSRLESRLDALRQDVAEKDVFLSQVVESMDTEQRERLDEVRMSVGLQESGRSGTIAPTNDKQGGA